MWGRRAWWVAVMAGAVWMGGAGTASAQLGTLLSPGRLARPHANLEGIASCSKCHEQGNRVTAQKCLACHAPIAERIAKKAGVHKAVTTDCVTCHAEHAGVDAELRPFNTTAFNHAAVTGFALDGRHSPIATDCAKCHTTRSFLTAKTTCASCHADVHKGTLGTNCATCHATDVAFKTVGTRFDHSRAAFPLAGAHKTAACATCHVNQRFKGIKFASCADCHRDPHERSLGATCASCHTSDTWRTRTVNHARTGFPLLAKHDTVACASCHKQPAMKVKPKADTCASCHVDVHRGTFKQDCKSCHSESGWGQAPFDHATTKFPLTGKHDGLTCAKCHTSVALTARVSSDRVADFRGLATTCASCHADVHEAELGTSCETCHSSTTFGLDAYRHTRTSDFFAGQHGPLACEKCHARAPLVAPVRTGVRLPLGVKFKGASATCATCHEDVHLGQEGPACETCHTVAVARFAVSDFSHATRTAFPLTGRHATIQCALCHKRETGVFPAKTGTAVRFKGVGKECIACHADVHAGQLGARCETCHQDTTFKLTDYKHKKRDVNAFFVGAHGKAACAACHKPTTGRVASGVASVVQFTIDQTCVSCHADKHLGALGPNCGTCHWP